MMPRVGVLSGHWQVIGRQGSERTRQGKGLSGNDARFLLGATGMLIVLDPGVGENVPELSKRSRWSIHGERAGLESLQENYLNSAEIPDLKGETWDFSVCEGDGSGIYSSLDCVMR